MTNPTNTAAIESLRSFALAHNEFQFAHLCTAALGDERNPPEAWAAERLSEVVSSIPPRASSETGRRKRIKKVLRVIRSTDTTRPDGLIARSLTSI